MKKTEDKKFSKNSIIIFAIILVAIVIAIMLLFSNSKKNKNLSLSNFEKIAVYGYLEDYLSLDKLYLLAGKSSYDELHYIQSKIKNILDENYSKNSNNTISISLINSELSEVYNINTDNIDYHGIVVSDYEFLPEEQAFKRVDGANSNMSSLESNVDTISNNDSKISIKNIEKVSDESYIAYFDVVDSYNEDTVHETGNVTIKVSNDSFELESCTID